MFETAHSHGVVCQKMHTDTSSYVKICLRTCPCKSKICVEARYFTSRTFHRISRINVLRHGYV